MSLFDSMTTLVTARLVVDQVGKALADFPKLSGPSALQAPLLAPSVPSVPPSPPGSAGPPAAGSPGSGGGNGGAEPPDGTNPSDVLMDLRLTADLMTLFEPAFRLRGWTLSEAHGRDFSGGQRRYTQASSGGQSYCFLLIPKWILDKAPRAHLDAVVAVTFAFAKGSRAFVLSPQLEAPQLVFENVIGKLWLQMNNLAGRFIPWRHVVYFQNLPTDQERAEALGQLFDIEAIEAHSPAPNRPVAITSEDLRELRRILAAVKEPWDLRLKFSGVAAIMTGVALTGIPGTDAGIVLFQLLEYGVVPSSNGEHALGRLLKYVRSLTDLPGADGDLIGEIITRYHLLP